MSDTLQVIARRYSCRDFGSETVSAENLRKLALAAISAPSGMNRQAWRVIVVSDRALIEEMDAEGMRLLSEAEDKSGYERMMSRGGKLFYNAPAMIVLPIQPGSELDCGIVSENIALAATSLGIDNVICGMARLPLALSPRAAEFAARLGGYPEGYEFGMAVLLGYGVSDGTPHEPDWSKATFVG